MSTKLPGNKQFTDVSDYARLAAVMLVKFLMPTKIGAYTLTTLFLFVGLAASYLIYKNTLLPLASILILLKSLLDAADGEIARRRQQPSMVGRYYDSICDFIINVFLITSTGIVFHITTGKIILAIILLELQGSIYNYYYLVKRYQVNGDKTSRILEFGFPKPFPRDNINILKFLHGLYVIIYGWQDFIIYKLDAGALSGKELPGWFLTLVSFLGLGFQLLIISILILFRVHYLAIDIFIYPLTIYSVILIVIRKLFVK